MKKLSAVVIFLLMSTIVYADAPLSWRAWMSPAHVQGGDGLCPTYAAIHCTEALYNYYYMLDNKLQIHEDVFGTSSMIADGSDAELVFNRIKINKIKPIDEGEYPNLAHSYFSVANAGYIPASSLNRFDKNSLLANIKDCVDKWSPVCLYIWGYNNNKSVFESWSNGDEPIVHTGGGDFHVVVVVDWGIDSTHNDTEYLECFNSFTSNDDHFFKISTQNFDTWAGGAVWATLHIDSQSPGYDQNRINVIEDYMNLNFHYAPNIYPYFKPYLNSYGENGVIDDAALNLKIDEEIYILSDTKVKSGKTTRLWSDSPKRINIGSDYIDGEGGYHSYYNDLIVQGTLILKNCIIEHIGTGSSYGALCADGGTIQVKEDVTIQNLRAGIYLRSNGHIISNDDSNIIQNCDYGIVSDQNVSQATADTLLIKNTGTCIRVLGAAGNLSCKSVGLYLSTNGIYADAGADVTVSNSNIGDKAQIDGAGGGYDIYQHRLIQGGVAASFYLTNNNITYCAPYNGIVNDYESLDVSHNYWGTSVDMNKYYVFSCVSNATNWSDRSQASHVNLLTPTLKIASPSPYEEAQYYESIEDWSNAKNLYMEAITESNDSMFNKKVLKSLLGLYKNQERALKQKPDWQLDEVRLLSRNEYAKAENKHKPIFDFLTYETFITESDYLTAIEQFEKGARKYAGTSVEVMMLSRIANIYGDYLDNKKMALECADRAATLNPGQPILMSAFMSAGVWYDPDEYTNKFEGVLEYYDIPDEPDSEKIVAGDSITANPNPFNPSTLLSYTLAEPSHVSLAIYSVSGQRVATLVNEPLAAGSHAVTFDGADLASGLYFYHFVSDNLRTTGKLLLVK